MVTINFFTFITCLVIVALIQPPVPFAILTTSYRTQTQNVKILVQQEHMRTNLVTGNAQTVVYLTVMLVQGVEIFFDHSWIFHSGTEILIKEIQEYIKENDKIP